MPSLNSIFSRCVGLTLAISLSLSCAFCAGAYASEDDGNNPSEGIPRPNYDIGSGILIGAGIALGATGFLLDDKAQVKSYEGVPTSPPVYVHNNKDKYFVAGGILIGLGAFIKIVTHKSNKASKSKGRDDHSLENSNSASLEIAAYGGVGTVIGVAYSF